MSSKSKAQFEIVGERQNVDSILSIGNSFVDRRDTAAESRKSVMIQSEGSTIRVTAESEDNAIQFDYTDDGIEVTQPGKIQVRAGMLLEALSTLEKTDAVAVTWYDDSITISKDGVEKVKLAVEGRSTTKVMEPSIGEYDETNGVIINAAELNESFSQSAHAANLTINQPLFTGVYASCNEVDGDSATMRFLSFDGKTSMSSASVPVELIGDGLPDHLWNISPVVHALNFAVAGETIEVYYDYEDDVQDADKKRLNNVHFIAKDKGGNEVYHIRAGRHSNTYDKYPYEKLAERASKMFQDSLEGGNILHIPRGQFVDVMNNARKIGRFNSGIDYTTSVLIRHEDGHFNIENFILGGRTSRSNVYSETVDVESTNSHDFEIVYPWEQFAGILTSIFDEKNPDTITAIHNSQGASHYLLALQGTELESMLSRQEDGEDVGLPHNFVFIAVPTPEVLNKRK